MVIRKRAPKPALRNVAAILNREEDPALPPAPSAASQTLAVEVIQLSKSQPRRYFDEAKLAQLAQSVAEFGILEPLLVRPLAAETYELVAGERRLRAARLVGLTQVPVVVLAIDERQAVQVALMENLQREDLNPVEETEAVLDLLSISLGLERKEITSMLYQSVNAKQRGQVLNQKTLFHLEQIETLLAEIGRFNVGTFRAARLPLLRLPQDVLAAIREGRLEYTKGMAIARIKDPAQRKALLKQAIDKNMSLNEVRSRVKVLRQEPDPAPERQVAQRLSDLRKQVQKSKAWGDRQKRDRITQLLDELDQLVSTP